MPVMLYLLKRQKENLTYSISHSVRRSWYGVLKISTNTIVWFFVCAVNLAFYCLVLFHCLLGLIAKKLSGTLRAVTRGFSAFRGLTRGFKHRRCVYRSFSANDVSQNPAGNELDNRCIITTHLQLFDRGYFKFTLSYKFDAKNIPQWVRRSPFLRPLSSSSPKAV